jgi:peptidoglycan/xylan/chitin deacetylase (PgdA/CDA1 family)
MKILFINLMLIWTMNSLAGTDVFSEKNITEFGLQGTGWITFTYDDGPTGNYDNGTTKEILDAFKTYNNIGYNIKATFFVLGEKAKKNEKIMKRIQSEDHIIGNHTFDHPSLQKKIYAVKENLFHQLYSTHEIILPYLPSVQDKHRRWYFRAPYGAWASQRADIANSNAVLKNYIGPIFWDIGGELKYDSNNILIAAADWACWSKKIEAKECAFGYMREIVRKDGGVILMHDINLKTVELTKYLLVGLTGKNLFNDEKYNDITKLTGGLVFNITSLDNISTLDKFDER